MSDASTRALLAELDRISILTYKREQKIERDRRGGQDIDGAGDASAEERRRVEEIEMRGKNLIKCELIRRHKVLMIRVGYNSQTDDRYFWDFVDIVQSKTDDCMVIVNNIDNTKGTVQRVADKILYLCESFPITFIGYFRDFFYSVRSWFTGLLSYGNSVELEPTIVFVDAHPITIPLLKLLFDCPVIAFGFYEDMLDRNKFALLPTVAETTPEVIRNYCLTYSTELLVPSQTTGYNFIQQTKDCPFDPTVYYPPIHGRGDIRSPFRSKYYILIIGPWQKFARMEFAFLACQRFYNHVLDDFFKPLVRFVFIGYMDVKDRKAMDYKVRMYRMFKAAKRPYGSCILTFTNPSQSQLATHYRHCVGVMNVTSCDFAWPLLEAVYFGRQVICLGNQFTHEIIRHGVNGFLQEPNINKFAAQLNYLFMYATEGLRSHSAKRIAQKFSYAGRRNVIDEILLKYFPPSETDY